MGIKPEAVNRDNSGYWVHSQYPNWEEGTTEKEINAWCKDNNVTFHAVWFEHDAPDMAQHNYYDLGHDSCVGWEPSPPVPGAFCFSIHDTEDGPVALFLAPANQGNEISN